MAAQTIASERYATSGVLTLANDEDDILKLGDLPASCDIRVLRAPSGKVTKLIFKAVSGIYVTYEDGVYLIGGGNSLADEDTLNALKVAINSNIGGATTIDPGAADLDGSKAKAIKAALATDGIDFNDLEATSWRYNKDGNFYWSSIDINAPGLKGNAYSGARVPVMCYNFNDKTYSVYQFAISSTTNYSDTYSVLNGRYTVSNGSTLSYEDALAKYNELLATYTPPTP